jgi:hypothetical protein
MPRGQIETERCIFETSWRIHYRVNGSSYQFSLSASALLTIPSLSLYPPVQSVKYIFMLEGLYFLSHL